MTIIKKQSSSEFPLNPILQNRWSPRALDENAQLSKADLLGILEAARWAPSAYNDQPWRYFVGQRGDQVFNKILNSLSEFNQGWAARAAVLILATGTKQKSNGDLHPSYQYDLGLSVSHLSFEALHRGYVVHQMSGFDHAKISAEFSLTNFDAIAVIAIGKQGDVEILPEPAQVREKTLSARKPLSEIVVEGLPK